MAISKQRKQELITEYIDWVKNSRAFFLTEYIGLDMKNIDELRRRVREAGGEFHIVKNTLGKVAFESAGLKVPESIFLGSTAMAIAFKDAPALAKVLTEFARTSEFVKVKGGYLEKRLISAAEVNALAELPPLPVMRAQLMGTILAPASQLARILAEPGRRVAAVLQAYVDQNTAPAEA